MSTFSAMVEKKRVKTSCFRSEIPCASPPDGPVDKSFATKFAALFPRHEFVWHPVAERWVIYEIQIYGGVPSDDKMLLRSVVRWPMDSQDGAYRKPGEWLIRWCQDPANTYEEAVVKHNEDKRRRILVSRQDLVKDMIRNVAVPLKNGKTMIPMTGPVHLPQRGKPMVFSMNLKTGQTQRVA